MDPGDALLRLTAATANVRRKLDDGTNACDSGLWTGLDAPLRAQFTELGAHIVGIQEGYATRSCTITTPDYLRFLSGPHGEKRGDVELWVSTALPWGTRRGSG